MTKQHKFAFLVYEGGGGGAGSPDGGCGGGGAAAPFAVGGGAGPRAVLSTIRLPILSSFSRESC